jgi:predicted MFS family arabinose efflux permease
MWQNLRILFSAAPSRAAGLLFVVLAVLFGAFVSRLPDLKASLGLSDSDLGKALLALPSGAMAANFAVGALIRRWGLGRVVLWSSLAFCGVIALLPLAGSFAALAGLLALAGFTDNLMNVSMNTAAAAVQKASGRLFLSSCHGMFSLGAMASSAAGGGLAGLRVPMAWHFPLAALLMALLLLALRRDILRFPDSESKGAVFTLPKRGLWWLALISFCQYIGEGSVADWSAVYLRDSLSGPPALVGLGYAGFSLAMALARFYGDVVIPRLGERRVLMGGAFLAGLGMSLAIALPHPLLAIAGFTLAGLGYSCIVPILYAAAGRVPGVAPGAGLASVSSFGLLGYLLAPPLIGFIADAVSLRFGLGLVALAAFATIGFAWLQYREPPPTA